MIRCAIIDDESKARETLYEMLKLYCSNVEVIGEAKDVTSGYELINRTEPELVLLDIKMPDGSGFDLLNMFDEINFKVIFITAHEEYAIKAFKFSALDYLLKPIDPTELEEAIEKIEDAADSADFTDKQFSTFKENYYQQAPLEDKKIILKTQENIYVIDLKDVVRCKSEKNYTYFYFNNREKIVVSKTLKDYEEMLGDFGFMRVHRSHLINLKYIDRFEKMDGGMIIMSDGSKVEVSHRKKDQLLSYIMGLNNV